MSKINNTNTNNTINLTYKDEIDERDTFWIFSMMVEAILPIDYYSNMVGVLID
jgi:hypothetical protein